MLRNLNRLIEPVMSCQMICGKTPIAKAMT
jgi:hypothetical protein